MQYALLGPLEVRDANGERLDLGTRRQRAVLAVLLVRRGEVVSLDRLIDELWGDAPPGAATASLQAYVSNLRRVLEPDRPPRAPARVLVTEPPGYALRVPAEDVDAHRFEQALGGARALLAAGDAARALAELDAALALWRGDALAEFVYEDFARTEVARLEELRAGAEEARIDARLALGDAAGAARAADVLVARYPLREHLRAQQILARYRTGRQAEALRAYEEARALLADELGLDPGPELQQLQRRILDRDPALDHDPSPAPVAPRAAASTGGGGHGAVTLAAAVAPAARLPRRDLAGRDELLAALAGALESVHDEGTRVALLGGEPGIGKTAVARALAAHAAERGATVLWAGGHDDEGAPPLWPWVQVLRGLHLDTAGVPADARPLLATLLPELGSPPTTDDDVDGDVARFRLFDAVRRVLTTAASTAPVLVVLDDLQWADASSLRLLRFLALELREAPVLLCATFREEDHGEAALLGAALADLARAPGALRRSLGHLDAGAVATIVAAETGVPVGEVTGIAAAVVDRTGGNPFFVTELVRLLASEGRLGVEGLAVPVAVRDVVRRRVARLPSELQDLLTVAAVIGREFELGLLAEAGRTDPDDTLDALDAALLTRLLVEAGPGRFRFAHPIVQECLYQGLPPVRRARLHRAVATALEAAHAADPEGPSVPASVIAHHRRRAGDPAGAAAWSRRAAEQAERRASFDEAAAQWQEVLDGLDAAAEGTGGGGTGGGNTGGGSTAGTGGGGTAGGAPASPARAAFMVRRARALLRAGDTAGGTDALDAALDAARRCHDIEVLAAAALAYGEVGMWQVRPYGTVNDKVVAALGRVLDELPPGDSPLRARALGGLAIALYYGVDTERRAELLRASAAMARRLGDHERLAETLLELVVMLDTEPRSEEQLAAADELEAALEHAAPELRPAARLRVVRARLAAGRVDVGAVASEVDAIAADAARVHQPSVETWATWARSSAAFLQGDLDAAERLAGEAFELHQRLGIWGAPETYGALLVPVWREQGRLAEVAPFVEPLLAGAAHPGARKLLALFALDRGDLDAIGAILGPEPVPRTRDYTWLGEAAVAGELGAAARLPWAAALYEDLLPYAHRIVTMDGTFMCLGSVHRPLGLLAAALGRPVDAVAHLGAAVAANEAIGAVPWAARSRHELAAASASPSDSS